MFLKSAYRTRRTHSWTGWTVAPMALWWTFSFLHLPATKHLRECRINVHTFSIKENSAVTESSIQSNSNIQWAQAVLSLPGFYNICRLFLLSVVKFVLSLNLACRKKTCLTYNSLPVLLVIPAPHTAQFDCTINLV